MSKPEDAFLQNAGCCGKETFDRAQALAIDGGKDAFGLYMESALQGNPAGAFMVSQYYSRGLESGDRLSATFWAVYAYMCGYLPANDWLKKHFRKNPVPEDREFFGYCEKLAENNGAAAFMAGMGSYLGLGTPFDPVKAYSFFNKSAELGNPEGMCEKALCLMRGAGTERRKEEGLSLLLKVADTGNIRAILKYAWCLEHGYCVQRDRAHALSIYLALADKKDPQAIYEAGRCYLDGVGTDKDPDMAYGWFLVGQTLGGVKATFGMARCMLGGIVEEKRDEGLRLLKETAEQGFPDALVMLGQLYAKGGKILRKDESKAIECFRNAADLGRASACIHMYECYSSGSGVKKDAKLATYYALRAAAYGNTEGCFLAGSALMSGTGIAKNTELGLKLCTYASDDGYMKATFTLANCYSRGKGVPKDAKKGFEMHKELADKGFIKSAFHVAEAYYIGDAVPQDYKKAFSLFKVGAEKDNVFCQYYLGECYDKGHGTSVDKAEALKWYRKAAQQGHIVSQKIVEERKSEAILKDESPFDTFLKSARAGDAQSMYILGRYYEDGIGIEKDPRKAREWYQKAKKRGNPAARRALEALEKKMQAGATEQDAA